MTANPRSKVKQRLAAAGIAVGATVGSFAAASALSSTEESTTTTVAPEATGDDTTADDTTVEVDETRAAEEPLTGDLATQVTAAAEAALPGGTVERVETDADGATYEAHMTDADGNPVTVTFDENIDLVETITGAPGGPGDHGRGDHHDRDDDGALDEAMSTDTLTDG